MATPPSRPPMSNRSIALLSTSALAVGAYIFARSSRNRAHRSGGRLIQPEEQARFQGTATGKDNTSTTIGRSGGGGGSGFSPGAGSAGPGPAGGVDGSVSARKMVLGGLAGERVREAWEKGGGGDGC